MDKLKTPLPWRYERRDEWWPFHHRIVASNGYLVAGCFSEESAKHIIRCVNTVDKALEVCRVLIDADALFQQADEKWLSGQDEREIATGAMRRQAEAVKLAREALEKAEGGA